MSGLSLYVREMASEEAFFKPIVGEGLYGLGMPGRGKWYNSCGKVIDVERCNNWSVKDKKHDVRIKRSVCSRSSCPKCFGSWALRRSQRAGARLFAIYCALSYLFKGVNLHHFVVSPPLADSLIEISKHGVKGFRKMVIEKLKEFSKVPLGGCCVLHFWKYNKWEKKWDIYPHFHFLGLVYIKTKDWWADTGWVYKNIHTNEKGQSYRNSLDILEKTVAYELGHATLKQYFDKNEQLRTYPSLTWFGSMSYRAIGVKYDTSDEYIQCEECLDILRPVRDKNHPHSFERKPYKVYDVSAGGQRKIIVAFDEDRVMLGDARKVTKLHGHATISEKWFDEFSKVYPKTLNNNAESILSSYPTLGN